MATHLHSHTAHDGPLVSLQGLQGNPPDVLLRLPQEQLAGRLEQLVIASLDLDLCDGFFLLLSNSKIV